MKNLMDMYLSFTEKKVRKYMKLIYGEIYDEQIVNEYLKTYINARYYNIQNSEKTSRAFYLRILNELDYKKDVLIKRNEKEAESREEKEEKTKIINNVNEAFSYILFFDDVRNVDNFKKINGLQEITKKMVDIVNSEFEIKKAKEKQELLYKEVKSDILEKEVFLEKFETEDFSINFENCEQAEDLYFAKLDHNINMPIQYSDTIIQKVFSEGIIAEDKLQVEYILLSLISIRDIIEGNFKDMYIAEFTETLFKKKTKLDSILTLIGNQALQAKIIININYSDYIENQKTILEYISKGYEFLITLDNSIKSVEDVKGLKMFKFVVAPQNLVLHKALKQNKNILNNVIFK